MVTIRGFAMLFTEGQPVYGTEGLPASFLNYAQGTFLAIPLLTWTPLILFVILSWALHFSAYGKKLYAVGGSSLMPAMMNALWRFLVWAPVSMTRFCENCPRLRLPMEALVLGFQTGLHPGALK